jgi:hypothetical protein
LICPWTDGMDDSAFLFQCMSSQTAQEQCCCFQSEPRRRGHANTVRTFYSSNTRQGSVSTVRVGLYISLVINIYFCILPNQQRARSDFCLILYMVNYGRVGKHIMRKSKRYVVRSNYVRCCNLYLQHARHERSKRNPPTRPIAAIVLFFFFILATQLPAEIDSAANIATFFFFILYRPTSETAWRADAVGGGTPPHRATAIRACARGSGRRGWRSATRPTRSGRAQQPPSAAPRR